MTILPAELHDIRAALAELDPKSSASAASPLPADQLYMPATHAAALDPARPLVVGNRGVGKSVWSGVLADQNTRTTIAPFYPRLNLDKMTVHLGFHEDAGRVAGIAPSSRVLTSLLEARHDPEAIWNAVLLQAVAPTLGLIIPATLRETIKWIDDNLEQAEAALRGADDRFHAAGSRFLLVFDALDRLAGTWDLIRPLTEGILRLTLAMNGYRAMRAKVFMRSDQARDESLFRFPDASKMRAARVDLAWHATELYGLLFKTLRHSSKGGEAFGLLVSNAIGSISHIDDISNPVEQMEVFKALAGEFMGSDPRRGRTYTWVIDHLADAFHETTPRSFLITLQRAAMSHTRPRETAIDYYGIREGVQHASEVRVNQLQEDYPWIRTVLDHLEGLEVPCTPSIFVRRWRERKTAEGIADIAGQTGRPGPLELEKPGVNKEIALLEALKSIGVVEERSEDRINMPDIFRVAAKIRRRGGVRPPTPGSRRA